MPVCFRFARLSEGSRCHILQQAFDLCGRQKTRKSTGSLLHTLFCVTYFMAGFGTAGLLRDDAARWPTFVPFLSGRR